MQQPVMEEGAAYEPTNCSYDDLFPALPESAPAVQNVINPVGQWNNVKMRVSSSVVTHVFRVPFEERKLDHSEKFGEGESMSTCLNIMRDTGAHIEISSSKDQSLTFLITGKQNEVLEARRKILIHFQTQASKQISIPKEHHRWILGKKGERLKELEKITATKISVPSMNDNSDILTITGTKEGIEKAEHQIRITSDEQSKKAFERISVPKIYHPFIVGAYNENLNAMINETGARINVPPPSVMQDEITIAGEKDGVLAAKAKIEAIHKDMEKRCTTVSVEVPKSQHKYVIGPRGSTIAEILQQTGISVEMPPSDSPTGTITLRGPHEKLGNALSKVCEKANSVCTTDVEAPSWIHKYIIGRKGANIKEITKDFPKVHIEFTEKENKIKMEGPPEEVEKAKEQIEMKAKELIAQLIFEEINVDPRFYKHIIGKSGANVNRLKEETGVQINIDESGLIRLEGNHAEVQKVKQELEEMVFKLENEKEKDIIIDQRHYRNIIGAKGDKIREIREQFNQVQINFPGAGDKRDVVKIRGPKEDVDKCHKYLVKLVKELCDKSYQVDVPIFKKFHKFIIGKGGANIRKIREETQTKIDLPAEGDKNDVITITGKRENVEEARDKIRKIQDEHENIISDEITIPPQFYNTIIGAGGKLIRSIMEDCGGVTIKFPSAESKNDKVTIRGPKDDVERAKQQLSELTNERQLSSYTVEVRAKAEHHKFLIGKSGANIKKIRDSTGARIVFPNSTDEDRELITIIGKKDAVHQAKAILEEYIKNIDNVIESEIIVDPRHHKHFVARRGEVLQRIEDDCGGVSISFPRSGVTSNKVTLKGAKDCIEAAISRIMEIVADLESMVTIECVIPQKHHRTVMGAKGHKVQGITSEFDVQIKFPDRDNTDFYNSDGQVNGDINTEPVRLCDVIRITGKIENCEKAKQALLDFVPITIDVNVPFDLHRSIIGQKGQDVKRLMDAYDVHIVLSPPEEKRDVIKITGTPYNVEQAKLAVEDRVVELEKERKDRELRRFAIEMDVNPEYHPKIIGRKGIVISKIRTNHDVQITFPKRGDPDEQKIIITGYEENVYKAKEDIMKIVNELNEFVRDELTIDSRVHSRLIGARGRNIRKIMDDFKVDIKFPKSEDPDPNLVIITGIEDNVSEARDHLLILEEEFLQDVIERHEQATPFSNMDSSNNRKSDGNGFIVQGGPWEQRAPNTASVTEFPSFGGHKVEAHQSSPVSGVWGSRR